MIDSLLLFEILLLLALTAAGLAAFERMRLPAIAGFLVVGAIAGPGGLGVVSQPERVSALAELGVIFLLFEIGLELPVERLRQLWRTALLAGGAQVTLTVGVVALASTLLGLPPVPALVLGAVIAMSSTALAMRLLVDRGEVDAPHGRLALAILILQDLSIVPFLLAIPLLSAAQAWEGSLQALALPVLRMVAALGGLLLVVRFVVPRVLDRAAHLRSPDLFSLLALLVVLGSAFVAQEIGLTLAVGAFLAGVAATASPYSHQLFSEIVPLRGVLIGLFFTAVGMLFEPRVLLEQAPAVLAYLVAAIGLKAGIVATIAARLARESSRAGVLAGAALAQTGEFSFVLSESAHGAGLLPDSLHQVVIAGSILSLLATPFLLRAAPRIADALTRSGESGAVAPAEVSEELERVIVIGFGHSGQTLARTLRSIDVPYVAVEGNVTRVEAGRELGEPIVFGDATRPQLLRRLDVQHAKLVALVINDPLATRRIVSRIRAIAPATPILARTRYVQEVDVLESAGASVVVAEEYEGALELVARTLAHFQIPGAAIHNFTAALREEGYGAIRTSGALPIDPWLVELLGRVETDWFDVPQSFAGGTSLFDLDVRARSGASVLAIEHAGLTTPNPPPNATIEPGDRLLVLGDAAALAKLAGLLA